MQLIQATCKFPGGQPRVSQSGREYVAALFVGPDGQEHRVYAPPQGVTTEALQQLRQGQVCQLAVDSKGKAHLCLPDDQQSQPMGFHPQPAAPAAVPVPVVQHQQPASYGAPVPAAGGDAALAMASEWARIFHFLTSQGIPPEQAGGASSTVVIQMSRR